MLDSRSRPFRITNIRDDIKIATAGRVETRFPFVREARTLAEGCLRQSSKLPMFGCAQRQRTMRYSEK